jgi:hypothetical protein
VFLGADQIAKALQDNKRERITNFLDGSQWGSQWGCTTGNAATVAHSTKKTHKRKRFRDRRATFTTVYVVGW